MGQCDRDIGRMTHNGVQEAEEAERDGGCMGLYANEDARDGTIEMKGELDMIIKRRQGRVRERWRALETVRCRGQNGGCHRDGHHRKCSGVQQAREDAT